MNAPEDVTSPAMQRILGVLEKKSNMAVSDISAEAFVGITTLACGGYISSLKRRQLIYISGWRKIKGRFSTPLYSMGSHTDVPRPKIDETSRDAPGMHRILETLQRYGELTYRDIARYSGLSLNTVKNSGYLDAMVAQGLIHVGAWRRSRNGPMSAVYFTGPGVSVEKPNPITGAEKCKRHRDRERISAQGNGLKSQMILLSASLQNRQTG